MFPGNRSLVVAGYHIDTWLKIYVDKKNKNERKTPEKGCPPKRGRNSQYLPILEQGVPSVQTAALPNWWRTEGDGGRGSRGSGGRRGLPPWEAQAPPAAARPPTAAATSKHTATAPASCFAPLEDDLQQSQLH